MIFLSPGPSRVTPPIDNSFSGFDFESERLVSSTPCNESIRKRKRTGEEGDQHLQTTSFTYADSWIASKIDQDKADQKMILLRFGFNATSWGLGCESYLQGVKSALKPNLISLVPAHINRSKDDSSQSTIQQTKEIMEASIGQYLIKYPNTEDCDTIIDTQELDSLEECSLLWKTIQNIWCEAQDLNAEIYLLLSNEDVQDFYMWPNALYIVEHTTIVYGDSAENVFDKTKLLNTLRTIDKIARREKIIESGTDEEYAKLAKKGKIKEQTIVVLTSQETSETIIVPVEKMRPIHPKVIDALDRGFIPLSAAAGTSV